MLQLAIDWLTYAVFRLSPEARVSQVINFFIYDSLKILILLLVMISAIGFLRTFLPQRKLKEWLTGKNTSYLFASTFGAVTPFCSCSSIPIFLGFLKAGVPLGVAFSFLIASPLINEYLVVLMLGFFGLKITLAYIISGIAIGTVVGIVLGNMRLEKFLTEDITGYSKAEPEELRYQGFIHRLKFGWNEAILIIRRLWLWVLAGVGVGALIHNLVPQETIQGIIGKTGVLSVPIATLLGVPLYGSCAAILPVAVVLFQKGIPLGTALSFMMAVSALSFPEAILLRRAMKLQLIAVFFAVTTAGIIFTGYLFNFLQHFLT